MLKHFQNIEIIPNNLGDLDSEKSPSVAMLSNAAKKNNIFLISGSIPERDSNNLIYNTCMVFSPLGEIIAKYRKIHLFDIDIPNKITFKESETLTPGNQIVTFDMPQGKVGIGICFDIRFPEQSRKMRDLGCKLLVFPGAFNMTTGPAHWELLQRGRAVDNQLYFCTVSPARNLNASYQAWGHSSIIDPWGKVIATTNENYDIIYADLDFDKCDEIRRNIPIGNYY